MSYKLTADYTCDLPREFWKENDIVRCIMPYTICGKEYATDEDISSEEFFGLIAAGNLASTSLVNQYDAEEKFDKLLSEGYDIIHISLSSGVSGSVASFAPTVKTLLEKYPDRKIEIIDTLTGSGSSGIMLYDAVKMQKAGASYDEVVSYLHEVIPRLHTLFVVDDLQHLKRGGRINTIEAAIGSLLGIKPMLSMNEEGRIYVLGKARGSKKAHAMMVQDVIDNIIPEDNDFVVVTHADNLSAAQAVGEKIETMIGVKVVYAPLNNIIGSHTGKNTVAVFYKGTARF